MLNRQLVKKYGIVIVVFTLLLVLIGTRWYQHHLQLLHTPIGDRVSMGGDHTVFDIKPGSSFKRVVAQLQERHLVESEQFMMLYAAGNIDVKQIHAGEYTITKQMTVARLLDDFTNGNVIQHAVTLIEGWTFQQIRSALDNQPKLKHETKQLTDQEIMHKLGLAEQHPEGVFFPDTYHFVKGTTDLEVLARANRLMRQTLDTLWPKRTVSKVLDSPYEALILASIIERESSLDAEKPIIAGVFISRLRKGMRLETDPTVIYGMGSEFDGNLRRKDLRNDTSYNTYTRYGLPPTPISNPGRASIQAALQPEIDGSLYFVAKGDGSHHFSKTYKAHQRAVRKYQLRR